MEPDPAELTARPSPAGSYVTHETKHFIYFYLGEQRLEGSPAAAGGAIRAASKPSRACPALTRPCRPRRPSRHPLVQVGLSARQCA